MAALVCDLCGGKLVMGAGGIATCDSCGMEHSADRMKEKVQEVKGVVQTDSSHLISNYMDMAVNAIDAGNNAEAEAYCNKIIEVDPTNYMAWMLKGEAAAWQSTLANSRINEGVNAFAKGVKYAPEKEKESVAEKAKEQIKNLCVAMVKLQADRFSKWPDEEETASLISMLTTILSTVMDFLSQTSVLVSINEIMKPVASLINQSVAQAYKSFYPDYKSDRYPYPDRDDWEKYVKRLDFCITLVEKAIAISGDDGEDDIQRYENLIFLEKEAIESCAYHPEYFDFGKGYGSSHVRQIEALCRNKGLIPDSANNRVYGVGYRLNEKAKTIRQSKIHNYETKIKEIKAEKARREAAEKAKNKKEFWDKHSEERTIISDAIARLKKERTRLAAGNTGFNQIKLIDTTLQNLTEIQNKDRSREQVLSTQERNTISELTKLWDKLKNMEAEDAYFDKNPLLKEESAIRNKLKEDKESLRKANKPSDENWALRIAGCVALLGVFAWFGSAVIRDLERGVDNLMIGLFLSSIILVPTAWGAVACVYKPIIRIFKHKKLIAQIKKSIQKSEDQLKQIEAIKKAR